MSQKLVRHHASVTLMMIFISIVALVSSLAFLTSVASVAFAGDEPTKTVTATGEPAAGDPAKIVPAKESIAKKEDASMKTYRSKHGFSIDYPIAFHLESAIDDNATLEKAFETGANHFQIYSYDPNAHLGEGTPVPESMLKIETLVNKASAKSLDEYVKQFGDLKSSTDFKTKAGMGKKIVNEEMDEEEGGKITVTRAVVLKDGLEFVFFCYPTESKLASEFDRIVATFSYGKSGQ
jgi:hypothetical protein